MTLQDVDPGQAQDAARRILSERRFRAPDVPRPFRGVMEKLGRWLADVLAAVFEFLDRVLPGPSAAVWGVLAVGLIVGAVLVAARMSRRRVGAQVAHRRRAAPSAPDPGALEAQAAEAEAAGDFAAAVRLRFRAGLLRLDARAAVRGTESMTSRQLARRLRSPRFDYLASEFDQIVYGGRPATADDAATARREWAALLGDVLRRKEAA